jgi:hypothetical protein
VLITVLVGSDAVVGAIVGAGAGDLVDVDVGAGDLVDVGARDLVDVDVGAGDLVDVDGIVLVVFIGGRELLGNFCVFAGTDVIVIFFTAPPDDIVFNSFCAALRSILYKYCYNILRFPPIAYYNNNVVVGLRG